ncbi:hypothetical protein [Streptomyces sasae]|uniref:hypothetical protein n=1 Tax=Streptomyces sasae TaxID=1266772 RepID=UPI002930C1EE|nr:hypothetical protein [Streptomyces sasae]
MKPRGRIDRPYGWNRGPACLAHPDARTVMSAVRRTEAGTPSPVPWSSAIAAMAGRSTYSSAIGSRLPPFGMGPMALARRQHPGFHGIGGGEAAPP